MRTATSRAIFFRLAAMGREDQNRAEVLAQGGGDPARPVTGDRLGHVARDRIDLHFVERDGALALLDHGYIAAPVQPQQPVAHDARIGHAAAQEQQLCLRRQREDRALVMVAAQRIAEPLVLVDDVERGVGRALLRLERGDDERRARIMGQVAGGDADAPALAAPLGELVVGQGAGRHGVDRLAGATRCWKYCSKTKVLPAPVGAWTITSSPAARARIASACHASGSRSCCNASNPAMETIKGRIGFE